MDCEVFGFGFPGLGRYSATTVLALLQEVTHSAEVNMDWNALVRNTSTGISDAREYQMLWRHLAYHHTLLHKFDHGAQPLVSHSATFISFFFLVSKCPTVLESRVSMYTQNLSKNFTPWQVVSGR